jgi:nucleoid-associated protein EbfC
VVFVRYRAATLGGDYFGRPSVIDGDHTRQLIRTTLRSSAMRPGGQPNMQQIMKQAQKMQQQVAQAQAELAAAELTGTAGGGLVSVVVTGLGEYKAVKIDPKAVDADDVETLEDLVLAAIHNAAEAQRELTEEKMGPATGGLSLPGF